MTQEQVFLNDGGMLVSVSRIVLGGTTYATANITSVAKRSIAPNTGCSMILILFGVFGALGSLAAFQEGMGPGFAVLVFSVAIIAIGFAWFRSLKPDHKVVLSSSSGEIQALTSKDETLIDRVVDAVSAAIVARG